MKYYTYKVDKHGVLLNKSWGTADPYYGKGGDCPQREAYVNFVSRRISRRNPEYEAVLVLHAPNDYYTLQDGDDRDHWMYDKDGEEYESRHLDRKLGLL